MKRAPRARAVRASTGVPLLVIFLVMGALGCTENLVDDPPALVAAVTVENLAADPPTGTDPVTGRPVGTGRYTLFSLREDRIIANTDSATSSWDLAFSGTTILANSGSSGPGQGGAAIVALPFEEVVEAPTDEAFLVDAPGAPAPAAGPHGVWYNYNAQTHVVTPVPGRTLVVRTADGRFAKVRILSYYRDNPDVVDAHAEARYYTFEYVFQNDGSRNLQTD